MKFSAIQNVIGRKWMIRAANAAYRCGMVIAVPMHSLDPPRNQAVMEGEYIRASSLELVAREIDGNSVPGAVAELGVYRGEFARLINRAFPGRKLYLFDTFDGFDESDLNEDRASNLSAPRSREFKNTSVAAVLRRMDEQHLCVVKPGHFPESAKGCEDESFAFVSIDADLYRPIYEALTFFYPRLSPGGYAFVHDYNNATYKGAKRAVQEYCSEQSLAYVPLSDASGSVAIAKPPITRRFYGVERPASPSATARMAEAKRSR
jgi:O-methyltransferase